MTAAAIAQFIAQRTGLTPEALGPNNIERAAAAAMERAGICDAAKYLAVLQDSPAERQKLLDALVIPETWFFRDREPFGFLKKYAQSAWQPSGPERRFRVLSAACSTGEEAYSIAITLLEARLAPEQFRIDAVDLSAAAIATARRACYPERAFRGHPVEGQFRYFSSTLAGWVLDASVVRLVNFRVANLVDPGCLADQAPYQAVFCRNMVIYLSPAARSQVLKNLDRLLVPGGILVAGHSELSFFQQAGYAPVPHARSFACVHGGKSARPDLFPPTRRREPARERMRARPLPPPPARPAAAPMAAAPRRPETGLHAVRELADRGDLTGARALCEEYLQAHPACAEAHCLLGLIQQAGDRLDAAEACYTKALYLDPGRVEALVHLALIHEFRGDAVRAALFRDRARRGPPAPGHPA